MLRRIMTTLFVSALLCGTASAQTVDELIAKNIKARGGIEKLKAVKTMKLTGKVTMQGMEAPAVIMFKRPRMTRTEFTAQGMTAVQGYDGTTAWIIMPFMGKADPQKMTGEDAKDLQEQSDFDGPLVDYKTKGSLVELIGKEDMQGTPVYKIKLTLKSGEVRYIFLDSGSFLEVKESAKRKIQETEIVVDTYFRDFKTVAGLTMAHAIDSKVKEQTMSQLRLTEIGIDVNLADSLFKMPAKAAGSKADSTANAPLKIESKPDSAKKK
jgi:hypothetical protein